MTRYKLISFNFDPERAGGLADKKELKEIVNFARVSELRLAGVAMGRPLLMVREAQLNKVIADFLLPVSLIKLPTMISKSGLSFRVARRVVTYGQINSLIAGGYEVVGENAPKLLKRAADQSQARRGAEFVSLLDGRRLAEVLNSQNPGRKFRIPTQKEVTLMTRKFGQSQRIKDIGFRVWTETEESDGSGKFVLQRWNFGKMYSDPSGRGSSYGIRLVEDW